MYSLFGLGYWFGLITVWGFMDGCWFRVGGVGWGWGGVFWGGEGFNMFCSISVLILGFLGGFWMVRFLKIWKYIDEIDFLIFNKFIFECCCDFFMIDS